MYENRRKEKIKACIAIFIVVITILTAGIVIMKYHVEGERNAPFRLSKITIVSTAEGVEKAGAEEKWNLDIFQNNDLYFSIEKNDEHDKEAVIDSVEIKNIKVEKTPKIGEIKTYMPNSSDGRLFTYEEEYILKEDSLKYKGANKSNSKTLEIGNQGGTVVARFSNTGIGNYASNEDQEIKHDGTMLAKTGAQIDDLKFTVNFDFVINLKDKSYVKNITLDMPCGNNLIEEGTTSTEITDELVLKRM